MVYGHMAVMNYMYKTYIHFNIDMNYKFYTRLHPILCFHNWAPHSHTKYRRD